MTTRGLLGLCCALIAIGCVTGFVMSRDGDPGEADRLERRLLQHTVGFEVQLPKTIRSIKVPVSNNQPFLLRLNLAGLLPSDGWPANRLLAVTFILDEAKDGETLTLLEAYAYTSRTWYFHDIGTVTFSDSKFYDACRDYAVKMTPPEHWIGEREEDTAILSPYALSLYRKDAAEGKDTGTKLYAAKLLERHEQALEKLVREAEEAGDAGRKADGRSQTQSP